MFVGINPIIFQLHSDILKWRFISRHFMNIRYVYILMCMFGTSQYEALTVTSELPTCLLL
jgi:hypothetical protein